MTVFWGILIIIALIMFVVIWCKWSLKSSQARIEKNTAAGVWYDERQIVAHGKAYQFAASVGGMYFLALYVCFKMWQLQNCEPKIEPSVLMVGGLWLILISYYLCCLMTDSVLPLGNYAFPAIGYIAAGALNLMGLLPEAFFELPLTGEGSAVWERLIMGFALLTIGSIHLIALILEKRTHNE